MIFNSWTYLFFLIVALPLSFILKGNTRVYFWAFISILFYAFWRVDFTFLMLFSALLDYTCSLLIVKSISKRTKLLLLSVTLVINLGLLVVFKYAYFIDGNIESLSEFFSWDYASLRERGVQIILPLGISFYTFQSISYTIDVYRGVQTPMRDVGLFLAYVTFWPQLVAGPILRANEVLPQLMQRSLRFQWSNLAWGTERIMFGLFKKVVLADNIGILVDEAFRMDASYLTGFDTLIATTLFGFQIYFDFAGYSDIGIGTAKILGIHFPENFDWPYLTSSPREFWKRWHISLSSWIRDYLYLPLTGQQFRTKSEGGLEIESKTAGAQRQTYALFLTWFIMGFWHGAGWNFAIWGLYHASLVYLYRQVKIFRTITEKYVWVGWPVNFTLMMIGWIPFRSNDLKQTISLVKGLLNPFNYSISQHQLHISYYVYGAALIAGMIFVYYIKRVVDERQFNDNLIYGTKFIIFAFISFMVVVYMQTATQFIYFQF